jgi:hypothetical protein
MRVVVFRDPHPRSLRICDSVVEGVKRLGWSVIETSVPHVAPLGDLIVGYGWRNFPTYDAYRRAGLPFIYIDLGYWVRKKARSDYGGNHKVVLNGRHATPYFQRNRSGDRLAVSEGAPQLRPWQPDGNHIVLAGLSAKGAASSGLYPLQWEMEAIKALRRVTRRTIVYRPKPSWRDARPIRGTIFSPASETIESVLEGAAGLVTLHSNAAIDALVNGVPIYAYEGLASAMSVAQIADIVSRPRRDIDRDQFLRDVAYCHWRRSEIASGEVFAQFVSDGLIG